MALQNYMPVLFSALGLWWIAQMIRAENRALGNMALAGFALITVAGVLKATWKLTMSISQTDVALFRDALFVMIGPGFTMMAFSVLPRPSAARPWSAAEGREGRGEGKRVWLKPLLISSVALAVAGAMAVALQSRAWVFVLMGMTTIANTAFMLLLMRRAKRQGQMLAFGLFGVNLLMSFVLAGIGGMPNKTLETHWVEQIVSTLSNAGFAYAAWMLAKQKQLSRRNGMAVA
jgi:hypothetical protein